MVDGPQGFKSSIPPVVAATSPDLAVVRFHGRRTATWEDMKGRATVERFRYLYDEGELREWVPRVLEASGGAEDTHVLMNNCYANYGSTNARELAALLAEELACVRGRAGSRRPWGRNAVPGFLPSVHGLRFANAFPPGPTLTFAGLDPRRLGFGDASAGLCGGMALTARDLYEAGVAAPADAAPPANGSPRFQALVRRQVQSLDWFRVPLRYLDLQAFRPDPPTGLAALLGREPPRVDALLREWPRIRAEIDAGPPVGRRAHPGRRLVAVAPDAQPPGPRLRVRGDARGDHDPRLRPQPPGARRRHARGRGRDGADAATRPGATGSRCTSRPASRCSASSASRTRRRSPSAPGADAAGLGPSGGRPDGPAR